MWTRGEGIQNTEMLADVLYGWTPTSRAPLQLAKEREGALSRSEEPLCGEINRLRGGESVTRWRSSQLPSERTSEMNEADLIHIFTPLPEAG